jgi:putative glutamine amidotransferase
MSFAPFVFVTATTENIRGRSRVRLNEAYTTALAGAGLLPLVLPPLEPSLVVAALSQVAGLVLTGGEDINPREFGEEPHPANGEVHSGRDAYELALARATAQHRVPTLAICRGVQVMNVALGGSLIQDIPSQHPSDIPHAPEGKREERTHAVDVEAQSRLASIVGGTRIRTNSSHHQSIARVARGLHVTARAPDAIVEAVESTDPAWWMVGLQWHPEELTATPEPWDRQLFAAFAAQVHDYCRD